LNKNFREGSLYRGSILYGRPTISKVEFGGELKNEALKYQGRNEKESAKILEAEMKRGVLRFRR